MFSCNTWSTSPRVAKKTDIYQRLTGEAFVDSTNINDQNLHNEQAWKNTQQKTNMNEIKKSPIYNEYPTQMEALNNLLDNFSSSTSNSVPKGIAQELNSSDVAECLPEITGRIEQARREFGAMLFFAVSFGMLKSGKSTLVNLLCGHPEASPTRFGQDTTLRPCLLKSGKKNSIQIFRMKSSIATKATETSEKKCFMAVMDYLRGVIDKKKLEDDYGVISREHTFNTDNTIQALCTSRGLEDGVEPLITVVLLKECSELLSDNVAILDLPGLDSEQMNTESKRYIELLDRCDLLLFIQSSISALNKESTKVLNNLVKRQKNSPIRLIQNRFEAQPWRKAKDLTARDETLSEKTRKQLAETLEVNERSIPCSQVNLGQAYDARFKKNSLTNPQEADQEYDKSKFARIEDDLKRTINQDRLGIQLDGCLTQLANAVNLSEQNCERLQAWITSQIAHLDDYKQDFDKINDIFSDAANYLPYRGEGDSSGETRIKKLVNEQKDLMEAKIKRELNDWKNKIHGERQAPDFNEDLKTKHLWVQDKIPLEYFNSNPNFKDDLSEAFRRVVEDSKPYNKLCDEANIILNNWDCSPLLLRPPKYDTTSWAFDPQVSIEHPSEVPGDKPWWMPWSTAQVSEDTQKERITNLKESAEGIPIQTAGEFIDFAPELYKNYINLQVVGGIKSQLKERKEKLKLESQTKREALEAFRQIVTQIQVSLEGLNNAANNFKSLTLS